MFDIYFQDEEWEWKRKMWEDSFTVYCLLYKLKILKKTSVCYYILYKIFYTHHHKYIHKSQYNILYKSIVNVIDEGIESSVQ